MAYRLGLARRARGEDHQGRVVGAHVGGGRRHARIQALVRDAQDRAVEAGLGHHRRVALVGHHHPRLHGLHARAKVAGAELLGARLRHRPEAPGSDHRVHPLGTVAHQGHHHVAAPHTARRESARQPRRAVGHLGEGDLPARAVARECQQRRPRGVGAVHHLAREVHPAVQRSPRLSRSSPSQAKPMAVSTRCSREISGFSAHQLATVWTAPTSICAIRCIPCSRSALP